MKNDRKKNNPIDTKNSLIKDFQEKRKQTKNQPFKKMSELGIDINEKAIKEWREINKC